MAVSHAKSLTGADWTGTVTVFNSQGSSQTVAATDLARPGDWNSVHNQFYTLAGNTTLSSTASGTNVGFGATGNLSVYGSNSTVFFSAPNRTVLSFFQNNYGLTNFGNMTMGGSSQPVFPFILPADGSFSYIRIPAFMSLATTTFATGAAGYGSSVAQSNTVWFNIYTVGTGASSRSLQWLTRGSTTYAYQISYSGTASTHSVSYNLTYPIEAGVSSTTQMTSSQQSSAVNEVPASTSAFSGYRYFDIPFEASLSGGIYYAAVQRSSTTAGGSNINYGISLQGLNGFTGSLAPIGATTNASNQVTPYLGWWTTNSNGATTSSIARSQVTTSASNLFPQFMMIREA